LVDPILEDLIGKEEQSLDPIYSEEYGAPGMTAWQVMVALTLRQSNNLTYDDLAFSFNHNNLIREFIQIPRFDKYTFSESCLGKNCRKVSPETIRAINDAVVSLAEEMGFEDGKEIRGDSFACQTNIHHPSDSKAIEESCQKLIQLCSAATDKSTEWHKKESWRKKIKRLAMDLIKVKRSKVKDKNAKADKIKLAYNKLIKAASLRVGNFFRMQIADLQT
jgi:hypothetical protein